MVYAISLFYGNQLLFPRLKADTHYPYTRPVRTGRNRLYGPYVRIVRIGDKAPQLLLQFHDHHLRTLWPD